MTHTVTTVRGDVVAFDHHGPDGAPAVVFVAGNVAASRIYVDGQELTLTQLAGAPYNPNATFGTSNFGRITEANPMRRIQVGARLTF